MDRFDEKKKYEWLDSLLESVGLCLIYKKFSTACGERLWLFKIGDDYDDICNAAYVKYGYDDTQRHLHSWLSYEDFLFSFATMKEFACPSERTCDGPYSYRSEIIIANPAFKKTFWEMKVIADLACGGKANAK